MGRIFKIIRESSKKQKDGAGPEIQKKNLDEHIANDGRFTDYEIVEKEYTQSTTFTGYEGREDFQDILSYVKKDDVLAFADSSRFGRRAKPVIDFIETLRYDIGCRYMMVASRTFDLRNENDCCELMGKQIDEQRATREWQKKGQQGKKLWRERGYFSGGGKPYGLKLIKVKVGEEDRTIFQADEQQAKVVFLIYELYLTGKSTADVAIELNSRGLLAPQGGKWDTDAVLRVLKRKRYLGVQDEKGNWLSPKIIDETMFAEVQKLIIVNANRGKREKTKIVFPLRNQCVCGCGQVVRFHPFHKGRLKVNKIFYCANHFLKKTKKGKVKKCPLYVNAEEVVDFVWSKIVPLLTEPERLRKVITAYIESCFANKVEAELGLEEKKKEIEKINGCINRIGFQHEKGYLSDDKYSEKYRGYQLQKIKIEEEMKALQNKIIIDRKVNSRIIEVEKLLPVFQEEFSSPTVEQKAWWLKQLVEKVVLTYVNGKYEVTIHGMVDEFFDGYLEHIKNKNFTDKIPSQRVCEHL